MDITFLVGNGFDLSLGYKTSYEDFYKWYLNQPTDSSAKSAVDKLKRNISSDIESGLKNWSDFEIGLGKFTQSFKANEVKEFLAAYEDAVLNLNNYLGALSRRNEIDRITNEQWDIIRKNLLLFYNELSVRTGIISSSRRIIYRAKTTS